MQDSYPFEALYRLSRMLYNPDPETILQTALSQTGEIVGV